MPKMHLPPAESMTLDSLAEVARGGMGSVELARALDGRLAGQILAVKRLHPNIAEDPEFVSMFLDEAWMTAALRHPNVAQVVAWGNDDKGMFLAIELVQGVSLSRLIKEAHQNKEAFAERTVAFICSQVCAGLVAAHTLTAPDGSPLGLVHRDLTPANVLISFDGAVKIIDFGIAKAEERISHTRTGQLKGKPAYMAPEQQRGGSVDARADLFSFGVVMFEMLAGRRPWTAKGAFDVMMEIANDPAPDLGKLRNGLNPEFVALARKCLEKRAEDRVQSAAEIKMQLDRWLAAKGFSADDQHSLAQFVLRNSQPQVRWWQEALRGEHAKKKAPTFKELEERIDEERERARGGKKAAPPPPPRPAAGRAVTPPSGTQPMRAYPSGPPESAPAPISSAPPMSPPYSIPKAGSGQYAATPQPIAKAGSGQYAATSQPPPKAGSGQYAATSQPPPNSMPYPVPSPAPKPPAGGGTEFLAMSPFAAASPASPKGAEPSSASHPASQRYGLSASSAPPGYARAPSGPPMHMTPQPMSSAPPGPVDPSLFPPAGTESGTLPMSPGIAIAITQAMPPGASLVGSSGIEPAKRPASAAPTARKSRKGIIAIIVVVLLGGAGAAVWFVGPEYGLNVRKAVEKAIGKAK